MVIIITNVSFTSTLKVTQQWCLAYKSLRDENTMIFQVSTSKQSTSHNRHIVIVSFMEICFCRYLILYANLSSSKTSSLYANLSSSKTSSLYANLSSSKTSSLYADLSSSKTSSIYANLSSSKTSSSVQGR